MNISEVTRPGSRPTEAQHIHKAYIEMRQEAQRNKMCADLIATAYESIDRHNQRVQLQEDYAVLRLTGQAVAAIRGTMKP